MDHHLPLMYSASAPSSQGRTPPPAPRAAHADGLLRDSFGRVIRDLRMSVTDRCNFRCVYCMDPDHRYMPKRELLSLDEYARLARLARSLGIEKLRLTGGEPTLYPDLDALIGQCASMGFSDLALTTNGSQVTEARCRTWRRLGLRRLTFSLDSLRDERTRTITRSSSTAAQTVLSIEAAQRCGFAPIKVNAVILRGVNDDEIGDFADFARRHACDVRLIEWMPLDSGRRWTRDHVVTAREMIEAMSRRFALVRAPARDAHETSVNFTFADGAPGRIGVIASVTQNFCGACSRLRLTADGKVRPCLFSHDEWDLRPLLRGSATDDELTQFIVNAVWTKQAGHGIDAAGFAPPERGMSAIGG